MWQRDVRKPIFLGSCILLAVAMGSSWAQWGSPVVDTITATPAREETNIQSLCLDDSDWVHLVWKRQQLPGWRIFYCTNSPNGSWGIPQEVADSTQACFDPAIAWWLTGGIPLVVYEQDLEIYAALPTGNMWQAAPITANAQLDRSPTLAIDNVGLPHVAWITEDSVSGQYKIAYAIGYLVGPNIWWSIQTLTGSDLGPFGTGAAPFIAVTPEGIAHVVYRGGDYGTYHIHHAWNDTQGGGNWSYEILYSGNANDFSSTMVIENDGDMNLAVSGNDGWGFPGRVYYMHKPFNQSWLPYELASLTGSAVEPSLSIDCFGAPHIVWMETSGNFYTGNIFYSSRDSTGTWHVEFVIGADHFSPSFRIDGQGYGHFACHTGENTGDYDIYHVMSSGVLTGLHESRNAVAVGNHCRILGIHPNPVRGSTTIRYHTAIPGHVKLNVYNSLGEEVEVLVSERMPQGTHSITWRPDQLSAGVHFFRLAVGKSEYRAKCSILK